MNDRLVKNGFIRPRSLSPGQPSLGFTLIELMVTLLIVGVLSGIAIPNYVSLQSRAKEASVKANMHNLHCVLELYAVTNNGIYPTKKQRGAVRKLFPKKRWPVNPFTGKRQAVRFDKKPKKPGGISVNPAKKCGYRIHGAGKTEILAVKMFNNGPPCLPGMK